jgi:hypothetical protein
MLKQRPEILNGLRRFMSPIKDDLDASFLATLHDQGLLPDELRLNFIEALRSAAVEEADASFLDDPSLGAVLTSEERQSILDAVDAELMPHLGEMVSKIQGEWDSDYPPELRLRHQLRRPLGYSTFFAMWTNDAAASGHLGIRNLMHFMRCCTEA